MTLVRSTPDSKQTRASHPKSKLGASNSRKTECAEGDDEKLGWGT